MYLIFGFGFYFQVYLFIVFDIYNIIYYVLEIYRIQMFLWDILGNVVVILVILVILGIVFFSSYGYYSICYCLDIEYSNCMQKGNQQFNFCMGLNLVID